MRPARRCRTRKTTNVYLDESEASASGQEEKKPKPRKKRPRRTAGGSDGDWDGPKAESSTAGSRKRTKRSGKLSRLQEMPLDLLFEIFAQLHPHDLLRLSRTTKTIRDLLMARSARATWIQALATIPDLPPCPEDMTECAWTHLLFDSSCYNCDAKGVRSVLWCLRLRACSKCSTESNSVIVRVNSGSFETYRPLYLGVTFIDGLRIPWEFKADKTWYILCRRRDCDEMMEALAKRKAGDLSQETFIRERTEQTAAIRKHAVRCEEWWEDEKTRRSDESRANRRGRKDAILDHLRDLGYDKEIRWMRTRRLGCEGRTVGSTFDSMKCVNQPRDLTPRIWSNMKEEVIKFMDETRVLYRADTHLEVLAGRVCLLVSALQDRTTTYSPAVMDLYSFEPVRQLLDRPVDSDPVTAEDVVGTLADVDAVMSHCRQHRVKQMMDLLRQSDDMPVADPTEAHLELATSLFCCQGHQDGSCDNTGVLDAPGMIVHSCWSWFMRERPDRNDWVARSHAEYLTEVCSWVRGAGGAGRFGLDATARARAAHIVSLVGLDPGTATYSDMDAVDPWFLRTDTDQDGRTAANWRQVVSGRHGPIEGLQRLLLDDEEKARAKAKENATTTGSDANCNRPWLYNWDCQHCPRSDMRSSALHQHVIAIHEIGAPVRGVDMKRSPCFVPSNSLVSL